MTKAPKKVTRKPPKKLPKDLPKPTWAKQWLEVGEFAGSWGWTVDDVLLLGGQGKIELCAVAQKWLVVWGHEEDETTGDPGFYPKEDETKGDPGFYSNNGEVDTWVGPLAICPNDIVGVKSEDSINVFRGRRPGADPNAPDSCAGIEIGVRQKVFPRVCVSRLVVTREEQERFRAWYTEASSDFADAISQDPPLGEGQKQTLLRVIGALTTVLANTAKNRFLCNGKINAQEIEKRIEDEQSLGKYNIKGLGLGSIRKIVGPACKEYQQALVEAQNRARDAELDRAHEKATRKSLRRN